MTKERDTKLPLRVDARKHARWKREAAQAGLSLTEWIEKKLDAAARRAKGGSS